MCENKMKKIQECFCISSTFSLKIAREEGENKDDRGSTKKGDGILPHAKFISSEVVHRYWQLGPCLPPPPVHGLLHDDCLLSSADDGNPTLWQHC